MKFGFEVKNSVLYINWDDVNADCYKIYVKTNDGFTECASVSNSTFTSISMLPSGENECFIKALKNGVVKDQTPAIFFNIDNIDGICFANDEKYTTIICSEQEEAYGYRLYKSGDGVNFSGVQNFDQNGVSLKYENGASYKMKPYKTKEGERIILSSTKALCPYENNFESLTIYKSYGEKMFLSWIYKGRADGFLVYPKNSDYPIFETNDGLCHFAYLKNYKEDTEFLVKAFLNTPNGKIVISQSDFVKLSERKYERPTVSLIVPAYNAQNYISRSIDSALASNFDDLEIVIVNDGSTDNTQGIIDWYSKNYPNVISLQKLNGGVADTRNVGIANAKGEYIAFMDNDDMLRPDMISSLYNSIKENSTDVAIAPLYRLVDKGYTIHCNLPFVENKAIDIKDYFEIMYTPGYYNCAIWNKLYKAELVKAHPLGILKYEDVSWTPCILSWAKNFSFIKTPFYEWDRKTRPETFGDVLAKMPEDDLFEHRKQAMMFFVENGNPEMKEILKVIAQRRLQRYAKNSNHVGYKMLIENLK